MDKKYSVRMYGYAFHFERNIHCRILCGYFFKNLMIVQVSNSILPHRSLQNFIGQLTSVQEFIFCFALLYAELTHVLPSSGISWKSAALIVRYSQKKECISFVFYCSVHLSIASTLESLV